MMISMNVVSTVRPLSFVCYERSKIPKQVQVKVVLTVSSVFCSNYIRLLVFLSNFSLQNKSKNAILTVL